MADVRQGRESGSSPRAAHRAADRQEQEVQEEQRKGIMRLIFEFFVRLLGIGKKREEETQRQDQQRQQHVRHDARRVMDDDDLERERIRERELRREQDLAGQGREGQSQSGISATISTGAKIAGAAGLVAGASAAAGSVTAQRTLLNAAKEAGAPTPDSLLGMAQSASSGPSSAAAPPLFSHLRERAGAVFAQHEADIRSRVVTEASTEDQLVFDHTQPSALDMKAIDQQLIAMLKCEGDNPSHGDLVNTFYATCMMIKLKELQESQDAGLLSSDREALMSGYLSDIEGQVGNLQEMEIPESQLADLRDKILQQLQAVYSGVAPKGHGSFASRVMNFASRADSAMQRQRTSHDRQQDFTM